MNRTRQLALGAVALVVCAAAAHEGRAAAPTAPVPTVSQPTAPPKLGISVGTPVPLRTVNGPIAYSTNTPYEHTFVGKGSRLYAAAMDAHSTGTTTCEDRTS